MTRTALTVTVSLSCLAVAALASAQAPPPPTAPTHAAPTKATPTQAAAARPAGAPSADEQVAALDASCAASEAARAARQAATPLFERLRGEQGVHALTREIVRLHLQNPPIRHFFEKLDADSVAKHVAEFMISGTGGPKVYKGPDLTTSHRSMKLTNREFVAAGGDVAQAMQNLGYGKDETEEVVCTLVALRPLVVVPSQAASAGRSPAATQREEAR